MNNNLLEILEKFGYELSAECGDNCISEITVSSGMFNQLVSNFERVAIYKVDGIKKPSIAFTLALPFGYVTIMKKEE